MIICITLVYRNTEPIPSADGEKKGWVDKHNFGPPLVRQVLAYSGENGEISRAKHEVKVTAFIDRR